jgi:hypothetical protein
MIIIGMRAVINNGVEIVMTRIAERKRKKYRQSDLKDSGIPRSVASTSFEKRLIIRPEGVDSKNSIVDRKIE